MSKSESKVSAWIPQQASAGWNKEREVQLLLLLWTGSCLSVRWSRRCFRSIERYRERNSRPAILCRRCSNLRCRNKVSKLILHTHIPDQPYTFDGYVCNLPGSLIWGTIRIHYISVSDKWALCVFLGVLQVIGQYSSNLANKFTFGKLFELYLWIMLYMLLCKWYGKIAKIMPVRQMYVIVSSGNLVIKMFTKDKRQGLRHWPAG